MKNLFTLALVFSAMLAIAQRKNSPVVPGTVTAAFAGNFPGAVAREWEQEDNAFEVEFDWQKVPTIAKFAADGALLETEQEVDPEHFPGLIENYIKTNYPGYRITEGARIAESTGKIKYKAEIKKRKAGLELLFDEIGNFISKETEADPDDKDQMSGGKK
jgi:hypothetical protein